MRQVRAAADFTPVLATCGRRRRRRCGRYNESGPKEGPEYGQRKSMRREVSLVAFSPKLFGLVAPVVILRAARFFKVTGGAGHAQPVTG